LSSPSRSILVSWAVPCGATLSVLLVAAWAFVPTPAVSENGLVRPPSPSTPGALPDTKSTALNLEAFNARIWVEPPPPTPPPSPKVTAPAPAPSAPTQRLLCIVLEPENGRSAVLYDPALDDLVTVREGDELGGFTVTRIDPTAVSLRSGTATLTLELDQPALRLSGSAGTGGGP
jgi:hypothetical protein